VNDHDVKAIIFDLDGVLVDGEEWHEEAFVRAMRDAGYEVAPDLKRKGYSTIGRLKALSSTGKAPKDFNSIAEAKQKYFKEIVDERCRPIDRVMNAVGFAYDFTNGKIAVATNSSRESAYEMLTRAGLAPFFNVVITGDDTKGNLKPHPMPYLEASYRLGVFSKRCLAIDDSNIGIFSAVQAMMRTLRIPRFEDLSAELINRELKALEIRI
jgi:HAD superfamily hydrolase (TIGR01509 family)